MLTTKNCRAVIAVAIILLWNHSARSADLDRTVPIEIAARTVALNPISPNHLQVGDLIYRGGLELSSSHKLFGGYSGLIVSANGSELIAVSDQGTWLKADLVYEGGSLIRIENARITPILSTNGGNLGVGYRDSEALAHDPNGGYIISFEGQHRLNHYSAAPLPAGTLPAPLTTPNNLSKAPINKGLEAIIALDAQRYLLLTEDYRNDDLDTVGWILSNPRDPINSTAAQVSFAVSGLFHPTDAALLPDGDVLVLERRYVAVKGGSMRLRRIAREAIVPGARLVGTTLATIAPPLTVDNMEGLAVRSGPNGETLIYVMSDDNFRTGLGSLFLPGQRTLLMMFELSSSNQPAAMKRD
jgi:hypothetical protein